MHQPRTFVISKFSQLHVNSCIEPAKSNESYGKSIGLDIDDEDISNSNKS